MYQRKTVRKEKLPALARVRILEGRIRNLRAGAGDYPSELARDHNIRCAEIALQCAMDELQQSDLQN